MADGVIKQRNKRTGEIRISYDGGSTWEMGGAPDHAPTTQPPAAAPSQPRPQPAAEPAAPEPSFWQKAAQGLSDMARGAGQGATYGFQEEIVSRMVPEASDDTGIPRTYGEGDAQRSMQSQMRRDYAEAEERSPIATAVGQGVGMLPSAIATGAAGGAARTAAGAIAREAAIGGATGAVSGAGFSEGESAGEVLDDATESALEGAILGGSFAGGARALATGAPGAAQWLGSAADRMRARASGAYGGEMSKLVQEHGDEFVEQLGQFIERHGIHKRGPGWRRLIPSTPAVYRDNAAALRKQLGEEIGVALDDAVEQGVSYPKEDIVASIRGKASRVSPATAETARSKRMLQDLANRVERTYGDTLDPRELHDLKSLYEEMGGYSAGKNVPSGQGVRAKAYRDVANVPRRALSESMGEQALDETAQQFAQANKGFGMARTVENLARKRAAQEAGNQVISLPAAATGDVVGGTTLEGMKRIGSDVLADTMRRAAVGLRARPGAAAVRPGAALGAMSGMLQSDAQSQSVSPAAEVLSLIDSSPNYFGPNTAAIRQAAESGDTQTMNALIQEAQQQEAM